MTNLYIFSLRSVLCLSPGLLRNFESGYSDSDSRCWENRLSCSHRILFFLLTYLNIILIYLGPEFSFKHYEFWLWKIIISETTFRKRISANSDSDKRFILPQFIIIISHYPNCWGTGLPYGLHLRRTGHNPPSRPSASWWVLTTSNTAGTNGLACLPKHGGARITQLLVIN
jgi:hypothetical protein